MRVFGVADRGGLQYESVRVSGLEREVLCLKGVTAGVGQGDGYVKVSGRRYEIKIR
jgi:hypothetical protein